MKIQGLPIVRSRPHALRSHAVKSSTQVNPERRHLDGARPRRLIARGGDEKASIVDRAVKHQGSTSSPSDGAKNCGFDGSATRPPGPDGTAERRERSHFRLQGRWRLCLNRSRGLGPVPCRPTNGRSNLGQSNRTGASLAAGSRRPDWSTARAMQGGRLRRQMIDCFRVGAAVAFGVFLPGQCGFTPLDGCDQPCVFTGLAAQNLHLIPWV